MNKMNNVILFPTLRRSLEELEEETYALIEKQSYEEALSNLDKLIAHQYASFEINVNKLHCLTKLGRFQEAEEFSEALLANDQDEYYYDYLGYYIMILYEQNNFNALMSTILEEEKKGEIPPPFDKKFRDIYRLCYQMNTMKANDILNDFTTAVEEINHEEQWYLIQKWIQLYVAPSDEIFRALQHEKVHPIVKTKLLAVFQERNVDQELTVEKFGEKKLVQPLDLIKLDKQHTYVETLNKLSHVEQDNPTLYRLLEKLLYQYHYVRYPFLQDETSDDALTEALIFVGEKILSIETNKEAKAMEEVQLIEVCSQLYLNLIPE